MNIQDSDRQELLRAKKLLERPSLAVKLTNAIGSPLEKGFKLLPERWADTLNKAVEVSLDRALSVAVGSIKTKTVKPARERLHQLAVAAAGAGGGAFGLAGLIVELPLSTTLMLRSIAEIARSEGEDMNAPEGQLACLEVFALGGTTDTDDGAETGYFAIRTALAASVTDAARYLAQRGLADKGAPALVRFMSAIGARFGIVVSEKVAAMAVPAVGAAGGAVINGLFIRHFQDMARGHFIVRRLERLYDADTIRKEFNRLTD